LLWTCGGAEHHGWEHMVEQSYSLHGSQQAKTEKGRDWGAGIPFNIMALIT
jgi:hypothetical protein